MYFNLKSYLSWIYLVYCYVSFLFFNKVIDIENYKMLHKLRTEIKICVW